MMVAPPFHSTCEGSSVPVAQACMSELGLPDIVIANAGISLGLDLADAQDLPVFAQVMNTNVQGLVHTFQPFIAPMCQRGRGQLVGMASVAEIDAINILNATFLAMQRAVATLPTPPAFALIDGNRVPKLPCPAEAIIKGDSLSLSIAAASIIAKVTRDRIMVGHDAAYPAYGFARHKGYGTAFHQEALERHGPSPLHRRSFAPIAALLAR